MCMYFHKVTGLVCFLRIRFSLAHVPNVFDEVDSVFVMKEYIGSDGVKETCYNWKRHQREREKREKRV